MATDDIVQVVVCDGCEARLLVVGAPCALGGSATFSVSCARCRGRVRLTFAVGGVKSAVIEEPAQ